MTATSARAATIQHVGAPLSSARPLRRRFVRDVFVLAALLLALLLSGCGGGGTPNSAGGENGTLIDPPVQLSDFTLPSSRGTPLSLSDLRGQPTLLFFGYTFCPDVCPANLAEMLRVKRELGDDGAKVQVVFVSVDGERDTPEVLARYLASFDASFIGLQGDERTLRRIGQEYGLYYAKKQVPGSSASYLIDHSAATYLIDSAGRLRVVYSYGTPTAVISAGVKRLLTES